MTASMNKVRAVLNLPDSHPKLITFTTRILQAMQGNALFPSPTPSLAEVAAALAEFEAAEVEAGTRTVGKAKVRDEKRRTLVQLLHRLKGYVQSVSEKDAERAAWIIESAAMNVETKRPPTRPDFVAKDGRVSGSVVLVVRRAGDRAAYLWQVSTDAGKTWRTLPQTVRARTEVAGLPVGTECLFRHRIVTKDGEGDWNEPFALVVR